MEGARVVAKVNMKQIATVGGGVITGVEVLQRVWAALDENGKVSEQAARLSRRVAESMKPRDPLARIEAQLAVVQTSADELAEEDPETAEQWRRQARQLAGKVPAVRAQDGKARREGSKDLADRAAALLAVVASHGLDPLEAPAGRARRGLLRGRGGRS